MEKKLSLSTFDKKDEFITPRAFENPFTAVSARIPEDVARKNLATLADYLDALEPIDDVSEFCMGHFCGRSGENGFERLLPEKNECGTSACALGHAPRAGIQINGEENWPQFCRNNFLEFESLAGVFMFGPDHVDCPKAAARRIRYVLEHGCPVISNLDISVAEVPQD